MCSQNMKYYFIYCIKIFVICGMINGTIAISSSSYIYETAEFRDRTNLPTLSNGHLGFVVYGDTLHMNGLYNGIGQESHRARIPNYAHVQFEYCGVYSQGGDKCTYALDIKRGLFKTTANYQNGAIAVELITYPHRIYDMTIVNHLKIKRTRFGQDEFRVRLFSSPGSNSEDLDILYENTTIYANESTVKVDFLTVESEIEYEQKPENFYLLSQDVPEAVIILANEDSKEFTWITTIGYVQQEVTEQYEQLLLLRDTLLESHTLEWKSFWSNYGISVEGNDELDKSIHSSLFHIASSLPSLNRNPNINKKPFYGLSPSGLGKSGIKRNTTSTYHQGHSLWDTEFWMLPPILLLEPKWSEKILHYRYMMRQAASKMTKYGFSYPWQSAYTGTDVTLGGGCDKIHVTGSIALAVKSHFFATHDMNWLQNEGCTLAYGIAEYWESRVRFNETSQLYEILGTIGPDTDNWIGNNNAYTNVLAAYNLFFGEFASCLCEKHFPDLYKFQTKWGKIGQSIKLGYDQVNDYHPQYDNYERNLTIIQADTILLSYPLEYPMNVKTQRNNLYQYGNVTADYGPAMTWPMHAIGLMDIDEMPNENLFNRTYLPYLRKPFYLWNKYSSVNKDGSEHFITGGGGFLQLIINGYAGVRLHSDFMKISRFSLPPRVQKLRLNGITYLDSVFQIEVTKQTLLFKMKKRGENTVILIDNKIQQFVSINTYEIDKSQTITLQAKVTDFGDCKMVTQTIGRAANSAGDRLVSWSYGLLIMFLVLLIRI